MARGGARPNSGPPPDPNALRRERKTDQAGWTTLPAAGRSGRAPKWPLLPDIQLRARRAVVAARVAGLEADLADPDLLPPARVPVLNRQLDEWREKLFVLDFQVAEQDGREQLVWREAWRTPQAVAWEADGWTRDVAQYVRHKVLGELGSMDDAKEARQWSDRLGLNPASLLRNRWRVAPDELATRRAARPTAVPPAATGTEGHSGSMRERVKKLSGGDA